jgi:hypothetical protein
MKRVFTILFACVLSFQFANAQEITSHQYRRVAPADMQEYLKRETTYWQKWAENEVTKGNLVFWGIFQKVGGSNQESAPNILIINTFKDWDKGADWASIDGMFPDVKMEDIQTQALSHNTDQIFLRDLDNHIQGANVVPPEDFNFVRIIYHNTKNNAKHLAFEADKWKPMVQKAMSEGKTSMKGWGNALVISPESVEFPYGSGSYDLFSTMQEALSPAFSEDMEIPDGFFDDLSGNYDGPRHSNLYRIVSVVTPTPAD